MVSMPRVFESGQVKNCVITYMYKHTIYNIPNIDTKITTTIQPTFRLITRNQGNSSFNLFILPSTVVYQTNTVAPVLKKGLIINREH